MIYASTDELSEVSDRSLKIGRLVAVSEFTRALVRHGRFDEYRFYCANLQSLQSAKQRLESSLSSKELDRVTLSLIPNFLSDLETRPISVLHNAGGWTALSNLAPIRNQFAKSPFPVTSLIHSLNEPNAYLKALKLSVSGVRSYDAIVCTSEAGRKVVQSFFSAVHENLKSSMSLQFAGEIAKIPLAVDIERFRPQDRAECRKKLGLPPNAFLLLHLGRISAHDKSDPGPLFLAFRRMREQRPDQDLRLVMAGGAEPLNLKAFEQQCRELGILDKVHFRPNFEDEDKPVLYGACDLFVSLIDSLQETFGISAVEAMACGRAPVLSDFDGYKELIETEKSGVAIPSYWGPSDGFLNGISTLLHTRSYQLFLSQSVVIDMDIFVRSVLDLVDNPQQIRNMEKAARQRAVDVFSWNVVIAQYESLWKALQEKMRHSKTEGPAKSDPLAVDYFKSFSHYPTQLVDANWQVSLTESGKRALQKDGLPAVYSEIAAFISMDWLKIILGALLQAKSKTIAELIALTQSKFDAHEEHVLYHVLWLAKYDVLRLSR